jgi:hypothetical protein
MHFEPEGGQIGDNKKEGGDKLVRGAIITGEHIQPNTWYALYVQTKLVNHPGARNAISKIDFVKTLFAGASRLWSVA